MAMRRVVVRQVVCLAAVLVVAGCSTAKTKLAQLSGKVTFKGNPVPAGYITFMPDSSAGNVGQIKKFDIKDGLYDTTRGLDPGIQPGIHVVRIAGFDGKVIAYYPQGKQIFNAVELKETIPEGVTSKDFPIPDSAANNLKVEPTADVPFPSFKGG